MEKQIFTTKIEEIISSKGFFLIDVQQRGDSHLKIIEIFIDGERGITTDDCSDVSRAINELIEAENLIESKYRLDVSSPGVDRPLKFLKQFPKHINRNFEVEYKVGEESKKIKAKLTKIEEDNLIFMVKEAEYKIDFKNVVKAKVLISF